MNFQYHPATQLQLWVFSLSPCVFAQGLRRKPKTSFFGWRLSRASKFRKQVFPNDAQELLWSCRCILWRGICLANSHYRSSRRRTSVQESVGLNSSRAVVHANVTWPDLAASQVSSLSWIVGYSSLQLPNLHS